MRTYRGKLFDLQLFAGDGNGGGTGDGNGAGAGGQEPHSGGKEPQGEGGQEGGFDAFLEDPKNQAEFDRRIAKALETQKSRLDGEYKASMEEAKKEAEKLAKMNAEQKKQYESEKKDKLIEDQKEEISRLKKEAMRSELAKQAARIMKEDHGIVATQDMLDFVVGGDSASTDANIKKLVGIIMDDRNQAEKARATGSTPRAYGGNGGTLSEIEKRIAKYRK